MEKRIITIVSTANSNKVELETDATTLGELKAAMRQANIAYEGMTFYEGLTKSELVDDASLLPHDVVRGQTTNNLVFMLTNTNKKIRSGYDRLELYNIIKEKGLAEECKKKFGKNFTMCKTSELEELVNLHTCASKNGQPAPKKPTAQKEEKQETANNSTQQELTALSMGFNKLLEILENNDVIDEDDVERIKGCLVVREENEKALYTNEEINDMFSFLKR